MQVPHNSFVLVVDGRKSLFFRNDGDAEYPNLIVEQAVEHSNPADHDQKTDR
ncbi:required for attachment to host cells family protein, partial [Sphingomonas sanguinis]